MSLRGANYCAEEDSSIRGQGGMGLHLYVPVLPHRVVRAGVPYEMTLEQGSETGDGLSHADGQERREGPGQREYQGERASEEELGDMRSVWLEYGKQVGGVAGNGGERGGGDHIAWALEACET